MKNREIKFRAWDTVNKKMIDTPMAICSDAWVMFTAEVENLDCSNAIHPIQQYALMQFTSLKDKNGKDIYEGDILLVRFGKHRVEVRWKVTGFGFFNLGTHQWQLLYVSDLKQIEVIGNIWEHPELLPDTAS